VGGQIKSAVSRFPTNAFSHFQINALLSGHAPLGGSQASKTHVLCYPDLSGMKKTENGGLCFAESLPSEAVEGRDSHAARASRYLSVFVVKQLAVGMTQLEMMKRTG
jgi:hypothetical protein